MLDITKDFFILLHKHDVGVMISDTHTSRMLFRCHDDLDVKIRNIFRQIHITDLRLVEFSALLAIFIGDTGDDFQLLIRIATDHTENSCNLDALLSTGIRHGYTLHVLDHVAGAVDGHVRRHLSEELSRHSSRIGDGDWLGTAHRRNQLLT